MENLLSLDKLVRQNVACWLGLFSNIRFDRLDNVKEYIMLGINASIMSENFSLNPMDPEEMFLEDPWWWS